MNRIQRYGGIDLCRGIAAFAVIMVHSGDETWGIPISDRAVDFRYWFYFAVPFFLATSFYFATRKLPLQLDAVFWRRKLRRIIIPYLTWSTIYLALNSVVWLLTNEVDLISELLADPLAIVLFGAACYHLYFMPLLFVGYLLLYAANHLVALKHTRGWLAIGCLVSIGIYSGLIASNNDFNLAGYTAFESLLSQLDVENWLYPLGRTVLVFLAWIIRCLPYFFGALLINQLTQQPEFMSWLHRRWAAASAFVVFALTNTVGREFIADAVSEIIIAFSLLIFALSISSFLRTHILITNLGLCSFGIYLLHPMFKTIVELIVITLLPEMAQSVSVSSMLVYALLTFIISWLAIALLLKNKLLAQYI